MQFGLLFFKVLSEGELGRLILSGDNPQVTRLQMTCNAEFVISAYRFNDRQFPGGQKQ